MELPGHDQADELFVRPVRHLRDQGWIGDERSHPYGRVVIRHFLALKVEAVSAPFRVVVHSLLPLGRVTGRDHIEVRWPIDAARETQEHIEERRTHAPAKLPDVQALEPASVFAKRRRVTCHWGERGNPAGRGASGRVSTRGNYGVGVGALAVIVAPVASPARTVIAKFCVTV